MPWISFIIAIEHTASGNIGCGVAARLDESNCTPIIGALVAEYLMERGQVIYFHVPNSLILML